VPAEDRNAGRRRDLEEILELRRSFGTLGRRLGTRQGPIRPGLVPFRTPSVQDDPDADADQDQAHDQEQDQDQVSTTVRRIAPVVDESYHVQAPPPPAADEPFQIPDPPAAEARRRLPWPWLVMLAVVVFAVGMAVDHAVLPTTRPAPPASTHAAQAPSAPPSSAAPASPPGSVPRSCLVTAQRADVLIDLLVKKTRGLEVTKALKSYTEASQTCRKEASSR
jgi:hypothetical protein